MPNEARFDALLPSEMAEKAEAVGIAKAALPADKMFALAVLAGAFVAIGAVFATTVATGGGELPFGVGRLLSGLVFCVGLVLVVVAGAELFTGNNLIVMAWASGRVATMRMLRNWAVVYAGNFVGAVGTAVLIVLSGQYGLGGGQVGATALAIAEAKCSLGFVQAVVLGALCNALVCLAVWLCFSARSTTDRILSIVFPITAFVAAGFEHSVANMYFIPVALLIRDFAGPELWTALGATAADYPALGWGRFVTGNLVPVSLGNIVGGAGMVGAVYWFIHLRGRR